MKDHCKGVPFCYPLETEGGTQQFRFITEGDVYRLIFRSKLPSAQAFESWVVDEVLPVIRKHGLWAKDELIDKIIADPAFGIELLREFQKTKQQLAEARTANGVLSQQLAEARPKVSYYDVVLQSTELVSVTQIAKDYGMSAKRLNKLLADCGMQFKQGGMWFLYQNYARLGLTQSETHAIDAVHSRMHIYWTQKGRLFIYDLLKSRDIFPVMEKDGAKYGGCREDL